MTTRQEIKRLEIKQTAQDSLMHAMQYAFEETDLDPAARAELSRQMERIEKFFGYVPGSWSRGV